MANIHNQALPVGTRLGVYEIKDVMKIDSLAFIYLGWNHHLKEKVEIQEYFPHDCTNRSNDNLNVEFKSPVDKEKFDYGLKLFLDDAGIFTQIEHPNLLEAENVLQFNGTAYLILSHSEDLSLKKVVQKRQVIADQELKLIIESILNALSKVHECKIIHGGIQPDTILLGENGEALLTGLSSSRLIMAANTASFEAQLVTGYTAPELSQEGGELRFASDFYALGATMYFCMTNKPPAVAQDRIVALSRGEPDPVALSGLLATQYSPELLQAIEWMLRPGFNDRPKSASEILALLKSNASHVKAGSISAKKENIFPINSGGLMIASNSLWIGIMALTLIVIGLWISNKNLDRADGDDIASGSLSQDDQSKSKFTSMKMQDQHATQSTHIMPSQDLEPDSKIEHAKNGIIEPEKQLKLTDEKISSKTNADDNRHKITMTLENSSFPVSQSLSKPDRKDKNITQTESEKSQKIVKLTKSKHQIKKQKLPVKRIQDGSIEGYLAAAKKAMKEVRFTTPPGNNAYQFYQMVLSKDPNNPVALAGQQKIVDRYAWYIRRSKADGEVDRAKRVLKKAESVLPNDPKLQQIRGELY